MSDRIAVMHRGRVEQLGAPEELYERPGTRFVADFIGTTNLLTGSVEAVDSQGALIRLATGEQCIVAGTPRLAVGRTLELSIRPESVVLKASNGSSPGITPIAGRVEQVAYLGSTVQYQVRSSGGLTITAVASKAGPRWAVGSAVDVAWQPSEALVLAEPADPSESPGEEEAGT